MITQQEAFNIVYKGIINQGGGSYNSYGECQYRMPNGRKCAGGFFLDDEMAKKSEDQKWHPDMNTNVDSEIILDLQDIHDSCASRSSLVRPDEVFLEAFKRKMKKYAKDNNLTIPEV